MNDLILPWLDPDTLEFPRQDQAFPSPNGLLAAGGDLSPARLITAYRRGIFPWYNQGEPILWWCPNPREVYLLDEIKISRSLKKTMNKSNWDVRIDQNFSKVIRACAMPRNNDPATWIHQDMIDAYESLFELGYAHSVETYWDGELVGGLYGLSIGAAFFGESMFSTRSDASKIAFVTLATQLRDSGFHFIDCQVPNDHLKRLGSQSIDRFTFLTRLRKALKHEDAQQFWQQNQEK